MKIRLICLIALGLVFGLALSAQNPDAASPIPQGMPPGPASGSAPPPGWRAGATGRMATTGMGGRGVTGTVIAIAPGYYNVKTESGQIFKVQFSANTRFLKQSVHAPGEAGRKDEPPRQNEPGERHERASRQMAPPEPIKSSEIKVGDELAVLGEVSQTANVVGAAVILQVDPERAKLMHERQANFGKTWLMGKVTAINETKVSILGAPDNVGHDFSADENTTFRKHRMPITLADVHVDDMVRVEGVLKDGSFIAASVTVVSMPPDGTPNLPRDAAATPAPQPDVLPQK